MAHSYRAPRLQTVAGVAHALDRPSLSCQESRPDVVDSFAVVTSPDRLALLVRCELRRQRSRTAPRHRRFVHAELSCQARTGGLVVPSSLSDLMGGTITICVRIAELIRA